jgi:hypothetical protein
MSSSSSAMSALPSGHPRDRYRKKPKTSVDKTFMSTGTLPFMDRTFSAKTSITIQDTYIIGSNTSVTVPVYLGTSLTLNVFPNVTALTTVFDQYRIEYAEVWFLPAYNSTENSDSLYTTATDLDDGNTPTSQSVLACYQTAQTSSLNSGQYHGWVPSVALAAYSGGFTSYAAAENQWLDCASPSVQHYGIKAAFAASASVRNVQIIVRARISFRGIRD